MFIIRMILCGTRLKSGIMISRMSCVVERTKYIPILWPTIIYITKNIIIYFQSWGSAIASVFWFELGEREWSKTCFGNSIGFLLSLKSTEFSKETPAPVRQSKSSSLESRQMWQTTCRASVQLLHRYQKRAGKITGKIFAGFPDFHIRTLIRYLCFGVFGNFYFGFG